MEEEVTGSREGLGGGRKMAAGEVELKEKAGTAWSHSYLNQKPWHPLSYPNQRRKWIAEQIHANRARRQEEVQREFAQEQEFFRQTSLFSKKDKEKMEIMKAVSFMYVRPPGYNAESAKAAEIEDEKKRSNPGDATQDAAAASTSMPDKGLDKTQSGVNKKARPKDVFGRPLPTEEEFDVLKNAPRLDTGAPARIKPFGVEVRNVRCLRCGNHGHQSGDRECPLKDVIMPNEESRLKRDDPLTAIMAQTDSSEPLKWELKQKPGMSPPRGGYNPDDPNQQIVADDIFDEYGGFLGGGGIPALLSNFSTSKSKKHSKSKSKHKQDESTLHKESKGHCSSYHSLSDSENEKSNRTSGGKRRKKHCSDSEVEAGKSKQKSKHKHKKHLSESSSDSVVKVDEDTGRHPKREHRTKKREYSDLAPYSFSKPKGDLESKKHSRELRENRYYSDSSSSESKKHSRRPREKRYYHHSSSSESNRQPRRLKEKRHYTDSSFSESTRRSRRSREKCHHTYSSASDSSDFDRHDNHGHHRRK